jgi:sec-independent protein translocase protein TatB
MFDIGFWELVVIAVVTLLVVGPDEFPTVVRKVSSWIGDVRRFVSAVKSDFDREINKAEEIKQRIAKETEIAELHKVIDETQGTIPVNFRPKAGRQGGEKQESEQQSEQKDPPTDAESNRKTNQ